MSSRLWLLALAAVALSACEGDSTGPKGDADQEFAEVAFGGAAGSNVVSSNLVVRILVTDRRGGKGENMLELCHVEVDADDLGSALATTPSLFWEDAVATLTNGENDNIVRRIELVGGGTTSTGTTESIFFGGGNGGGFTPDFAGGDLTRVVLHVDAISFDTPGSDPNGNGIWTDFSIEGRLVFYGNL